MLVEKETGAMSPLIMGGCLRVKLGFRPLTHNFRNIKEISR